MEQNENVERINNVEQKQKKVFFLKVHVDET